MTTEWITLPALGRTAVLGSLYNARTERFECTSILQNFQATTQDVHKTETHFIKADLSFEKLRKLDIGASLQVSVLAGFINPEGFGRCLLARKKTELTATVSFYSQVQSIKESLNIDQNLDLISPLQPDICENATHVVTEITWGARAIAQIWTEAKNKESVRELQCGISLDVGCYQPGSTSSGIMGSTTKGHSNYQFQLHADILRKTSPTNWMECVEMAKGIGDLVANNGKGVQLFYKLAPLSWLEKILAPKLAAYFVCQTIEENTFVAILKYYEDVENACQKVLELCAEADKFKMCLQDKEQKQLSNILIETNSFRNSFVSELTSELNKVKSGKATPSVLMDWLSRQYKKDYSPSMIELHFNRIEYIQKKIERSRSLISKGAIYVGRGQDVMSELLENASSKAYVLYFSHQVCHQQPDNWYKHMRVYQSVMNPAELDNNKASETATDGPAFYAVDLEFQENENAVASKMYIQVMENGKITISDYLKHLQELKDTPWAKHIDSQKPKKCRYKPNARALLQIPCPKTGCEYKKKFTWKCFICKEKFEYGIEDCHAYCGCGKIEVKVLEFKCTESGHGENFENPDISFLLECLKQLRQFKELNVLLLGQTGVGKSTFINALTNYFSFETIDEAKKAKNLDVTVPMRFAVRDDQNQIITITIGSDENEAQEPGKSGTQSTRVYTLKIGEVTVRLIDTPGIADVRGVDQDAENFQNILGTISNLDELHAVCIFIPSNICRLTFEFKYCIMDILTNLHVEAIRNFLFCVTKTRGDDYETSEAAVMLNKLFNGIDNITTNEVVSPNTLFSLDNEACKYLATLRLEKPFMSVTSKYDSYCKSWKHSKTETIRMFQHISSLPPHQIGGTLNLNYARTYVKRLTGPLIEINTLITDNQAQLENEKLILNNIIAKIENYSLYHPMKVTALKFVQMDYPVIACHSLRGRRNPRTETECVDLLNSFCHEDVVLEDVDLNSIGDIKMKKHTKFFNSLGLCRVCSLPYKRHYYKCYRLEMEEQKVDEISITDPMNNANKERKVAEDLVRVISETNKEYMEELRVIEDACVQFCCFLKYNAITAFNDQHEAYLKILIEVENENPCEKKLKHLEKSLETYVKDRDQLLEKLANVDSRMVPPGPKEIHNLIDKLKNLKHTGSMLKEALQCIQHTSKVIYKEHRIKHPVKREVEEAIFAN